ncbi:MAG: VWA domain-containing protein [Deltaproteobacteria bacterium]|nr:VWA domain-containing protein [Deltaproteobacteria bacterium]
MWLFACVAQAGRGGSAAPGWAELVPSEASAYHRAYTSAGELPQMVTLGGTPLPLRHTAVKAEITGLVARVEVTQTYDNAHEVPIEAVYTFPLPENSAVDDMRIVIGDRVIASEIKRREEARRTYEHARAEGQTAALLEQERANVFTQSVANIAPGESIDVVVRYVQDLTYDAGQYEFVFPMVVGPRFVDERVPDADRVTPPVAGPGTRTGHDIAVEVSADAGVPIRGFDAPTHAVSGGLAANGTLSVSLAHGKTIPNRDFVLRYGVAGKAVVPALFLEGDDAGGHFSLVVQPPDVDVDQLVGARELVFVVDVSGSMAGVPLAICQAAMREALRSLRPVDTFNIITFSGRTGMAFDGARPANDDNIRAALAFVHGLTAGGSTEILDAVDTALSPRVGTGRHRYVLFLTDGYVAIEDEVYARTRQWVQALATRGQRARVFSLGVGSSVNRDLLSKLAKAGRGLDVYVTTREDPRVAVRRFQEYIDHAIWTSIEVDWRGMRVVDVSPSPVPDLFASRPLVIHGRYEGKPATAVGLSARYGERVVSASARALPSRVAPGVVRSLWARSRVDDLQHLVALDGGHGLDVEITELALEHRLVTRYTSFVAVDRSRTVGKGAPMRIVQAVEGPEGVDLVASGALVNERRMLSAQTYEFEEDDAPQLTSRLASREETVFYERESPESRRGGGCAHCEVGTEPARGWGGWMFALVFVVVVRRRAV